MRSPWSTSRSTSCPAGMARHHPCPQETDATSCQWEALPLAAAVRASAGAWTAPPRRLPCTGLPCREPCLPAPAVRPWCSGRCAGRTSHSTSKRTSGAGVPAVARRGAGSVWTPFHGTAYPARPDIGSRHPQASRSRPGRATGHPRGQASSASSQALPVSESKTLNPSKATSRPNESPFRLVALLAKRCLPPADSLAYPASRQGSSCLAPAATSPMGTVAVDAEASPCPCLRGGCIHAVRSRWCQNSVRASQGWHGVRNSQRLLCAVVGWLHNGVADAPGPVACKASRGTHRAGSHGSLAVHAFQEPACRPVSMVRVLHRPAPWESPCGRLGRLHGHVRHHCRPAGCWDSLPAVGAPP